MGEELRREAASNHLRPLLPGEARQSRVGRQNQGAAHRIQAVRRGQGLRRAAYEWDAWAGEHRQVHPVAVGGIPSRRRQVHRRRDRPRAVHDRKSAVHAE